MLDWVAVHPRSPVTVSHKVTHEIAKKLRSRVRNFILDRQKAICKNIGITADWKNWFKGLPKAKKVRVIL